MAQSSSIEWTDATWNPVTGCTEISPGCDNCYARRFSERFRGVPGHPFERGFGLTLRPERLRQPFEWRASRRIFVNSMSDLFHKDVPANFAADIFDVMEKATSHTFQVLTKRSARMRKFVAERYRECPVPSHIWLGVSVENREVIWRIRHLQRTNATIRFLSVEPLIGDIGEVDLSGIQWVIVGGESGPKARPMQPNWARRVRDICAAQDVPFFFKQWGTWSSDGGRGSKRANGRMLDGRTWDEMPALTKSAFCNRVGQ